MNEDENALENKCEGYHYSVATNPFFNRVKQHSLKRLQTTDDSTMENSGNVS